MAKDIGSQPGETGKQRRSRIELRYYRVRDEQARLRGRLVLLALLIAAIWIAAAPSWEPGRAPRVRFFQWGRLASSGPLAKPHAIWESTCEACHIPFTPVNGSRWSPSLWNGQKVSDNQCRTCHAGPEHHAAQRAEDVSSCAACHRDHRGRDASLLLISDSVCTACHANLPGHRATQFDSNPEHHPAFTAASTPARADAVRIKFSHAVHLARGLTPTPGGAPFTLAQLHGTQRARYGKTAGGDLKTPVQLECASCHQLDGEEYARGWERPMTSLVPPRTAGDFMLPVTYENHCRACHPLQFDPRIPDGPIRHGLSAREVVDELRRLYTSDVIAREPNLLRRFVPPRPIPGPPEASEVVRAREAVEDKVVGAIKLLFVTNADEAARARDGLPAGRRGCIECHELKSVPPALVSSHDAESLEVQPVVVRSLWFESAKFNHSKHRAVECASCHKGAPQSKDQSGSLLPGVAECIDCHAHATVRNGQARGGVSSACTECHWYHNGDHPGQGLGATARRGTVPLSLEQFFRGGVE
jgi:hypothetical protein